MKASLAVLRLTPALDWRAVDGAPDHEENIGGLATQAALQMAATAKLGVRQSVVTMAAPGLPRAASAGDLVEVRAVGSARAAGVHRRNLLWLAGVVAEVARRRRSKPDVIHVHASGLFEPLLAAVAAGVILRRPVVLDVHCSAIATYVAQSRRDELVQIFTRAAERAAVRRSAATLTLTSRVAAVLGNGAAPMPDWVETARFAPGDRRRAATARFADCHRIPQDQAVALFAGRVSREKGWPALLAVARDLSDLPLHVVVCGSGPDLPALRAAIQTQGLDDSFTLVGAVSLDDVAAALGLASVLVLPSAHEELGSVLIEAMAAGVPAVAYDVGGTAEAIQDGVTGILVRSGDESALVAAVRRALENDELRESARTVGPRRARERHDPGVAGAALLGLYTRLAGRSV